MRIFYTTKRIFWSNEGQDYLEDTQFNEFFSGQWTELSNVKSINWTSHYEASFYATDAFDATYFKLEKNNQTYYFFVQDIKNDSANGKFWYLTLDLYNTYGRDFIGQMKVLNPKVSFKRKHANRYFKSNNPARKFCFDFNKQRYLLTPPSTLANLGKSLNTYPTASHNVVFKNEGSIRSLYRYYRPPSGAFNDRVEHATLNLHPSYYYENWYHEYLIIKRPGSYPKLPDYVKDPVSFNEEPIKFLYIPVEPPDDKGPLYFYGRIDPDPYTRGGRNVSGIRASHIDRIPSDLLVGVVRSPFPPAVFSYFTYWQEMFDNDWGVFKDVVVLTRPMFKELNILKPFEFNSIRETEQYLTYLDEPLLALSSLTKLQINSAHELSTLCFFKANTNRPESYIVDNGATWMSTASSSFFIRPPRGALEHEYQMQRFIEPTYKTPVYGDVLNNYLLNNANAVSTGIQNKVGSAILGGIGGLVNVAGSIVSGNVSGAAQGAVGIAQSAWGVAQTVRSHQAQLADLGNRVDDLKDVYGKGATVEPDQCLVVSKYELPEHIKELVFKDIYFNGYEFNGVDNFNSYRNRKIFNYFEITDINQFLNLYTTYPKQIISDLSEKFMNGIRLWRTTAVNFDMSLDNREISFD